MKRLILTLTVFLLVLGLWAASWYLLLNTKYFADWPERAMFGDMFGAVNALFSGFAFAGVIIALVMQKRELELQRMELEQTREELKGQKEQLRLQNETFRQQNFESTFFQLIRLHHDIVDALQLRDGKGNNWTGRIVFEILYDKYRNHYTRSLEKSDPKNLLSAINQAYLEFHHHHKALTGHYFRLLYNIIKFVHNSEISKKKLYTNLVRAQLSSNELLLLFYNCLSELGTEKFRPLVEEHNLLKNMPRENLIDQEHLKYYSNIAFGP